MSFLAGMVFRDGGDLGDAAMADLSRVTHAQAGRPGLGHSGGTARFWQGGGAMLAQVSVPITRHDALDCLPAPVGDGLGMLVFDGRLDNRADVCCALSVGAERGASLGDGALVALALERWGEAACPHLIGDFALGWWNPRNRRLLLACDSDGGRTLYYHHGPRGLVFSTRPLAVQALARTPRAVDQLTLAHMVLSRPPPPERTPYQDIARLPAAGRLLWTPETIRRDRYWRPDWHHRLRLKRDDDYVQAGRELLDQVVAARLRVEGPVVCHLSAGLDSPAVAATAARLAAPGVVHTITTTPAPGAPLPTEPGHQMFDEWPLAAQVAAFHPNIVAHRAAAGALTEMERDPALLFESFGWPVRNPLNLGSFQPGFAQARALGARAILTGLAGNPLLSWQALALPADLLASGRWLAAARQVAGLRRDGVAWGDILARRLVGPLLSPDMLAWWRRLRRRAPAPWHRQSALSRQCAGGLDVAAVCDGFWLPLDAPSRDGRARQRLLEQHWSRRQFQAAHPYVSGCELRDPLGDRRMVAFCLSLPPEQWQLGGVRRSFARRVIADRVPAALVENRRLGFQGADWHERLRGLRAGMADEIERLERCSTARAMLDLERMRQVLADWPQDCSADDARQRGLLTVLQRGLHFGAFIRWVEGGN